PHTLGAVHEPQSTLTRLTAQLSISDTAPQFFPSRAQNAALLSAIQPQTPGVPPPPQVCPVRHLPQSSTVRVPPQLSGSEAGPQNFPSRAQKAESDSVLLVPTPLHKCQLGAHVH